MRMRRWRPRGEGVAAGAEVRYAAAGGIGGEGAGDGERAGADRDSGTRRGDGGDALLVFDGLPGLRDQCAEAGAAEFFVQLELWGLPGVSWAGFDLRLRSGKDDYGLVEAFAGWGDGAGSGSQYLLRLIKLAGEKYKINLKVPFAELSETHRRLLLYGPPRNEAGRTGFHGIFAYLRSNLEETKSEGYREYMMQYMSATTCPRCKGRRLRPESLAVTIPIADASPSIADFTMLSSGPGSEVAARTMSFVPGRDRIDRRPAAEGDY